MMDAGIFDPGIFDTSIFDTAGRPPSSPLGNGMQVKVSPANRQPYIVPLRSAPQFGSLALGGYSTATIVQARLDTRRDLNAHLLYADVEIWGRQGPCWRGVVESSDKDGTLHCVGPQQAMGWYPATAKTASTDFSSFIDHCVAAIPSWLIPGTGFVMNNPLVLGDTITQAETDISTQLADVLKYDSWEWGWYWEFVQGVWGCYPHYAPASTMPDYIVTLSAEDAQQFMGDSLANMTSRVVTTWGPSNTIATTQDIDPSHYLVQSGRDKTEFLSSPNTNSAADAALIAAAKIIKKATTKAGRTKTKKASTRTVGYYSVGEPIVRTHAQAVTNEKRYVAGLTARINASHVAGVATRARGIMSGKGTGTSATSRVQLPSGLPAYFPSVRAGTLARVVGLPTGPIDLRIAATNCTGDHAISLDMGIDSGRLDALLARVG
jgi:hypothetical protein